MSATYDLARVSPFFRDDMSKLLETTIQSHETIVWAGNISQLQRREHPFPFGYMLLTSHRVIMVLFDSEYESSSLFLFLLGLVIWPLFFFLSDRSRRSMIEIEITPDTDPGGTHAIDRPSFPLTNKESASRRVFEYSLEHIAAVQRQDLLSKDHARALVHLRMSFFPDQRLWSLFYDPQDAKEVYEILMANLLKQKTLAPTDTELSAQLEKLAELHASRILSDLEFEAAKKRLIGSGKD